MKHLTASFSVISFSIMLVICSNAFAKAPVWKVSKGDDYLYLGGTVHLLSQTDYPLPPAFEKAYANADEVWLETDVSQLEAADMQAKMLQVMMYQDHRALSTELRRDTYQQLSELLTSRNLPMAAFDKFTPAGLMFTLTALELQRLQLIDENAGVDLHFDKRAKTDGKTRVFLESAEEQLNFMLSINELEPNRLVLSTIAEIEQTGDAWADLLKAWRTGDIALMETAGIEQMQSEYPRIYQQLLVSRNKDWMLDLAKMMDTDEIEFVLVGALHMAGDDGLLRLLGDAGYQVEQLD